jgi:hypothetical protein
MSQPNELNKLEIKEADKPFYLAVISAILFSLIVIFGACGAIIGNLSVIEFCKWAGTSVFGLMSMAWTYYLVKKEEKV